MVETFNLRSASTFGMTMANAGPWRVFTVADLVAMPSEVPSGTVLYELENGRPKKP